jgi:hypothetical protein
LGKCSACSSCTRSSPWLWWRIGRSPWSRIEAVGKPR